jgi:2-polyprenyl-3-methyl-5-hydroxy-6-metoxy-1,4-benzoquinol methylase
MPDDSCMICGNRGANRTHVAREMMLGLRTEFGYLECQACGCVQLQNPPEDLAKYYPSQYYSFQAPKVTNRASLRLKKYLRKHRNKTSLNGTSILGDILGRIFPYPELRALRPLRLRRNSKILDVGCGSGGLLLELRDLGFVNLLGVDAFIERDIQYSNGVQIKKGVLEDLSEGIWDVIIFNHSFEHMPDPRRTLEKVSELLSNGGQCLIRVPVAAGPWKQYGVSWVELDAPRHFYLHTEKSMQILADQAKLDIRASEYDSSEFQFWGSELYLRDIPLATINQKELSRIFTKKKLREFRQQSRKLNEERQGGRAAFYLQKKSEATNGSHPSAKTDLSACF